MNYIDVMRYLGYTALGIVWGVFLVFFIVYLIATGEGKKWKL